MLIVSIVITNDCSQNGGNKLAADLRIELAKLGLGEPSKQKMSRTVEKVHSAKIKKIYISNVDFFEAEFFTFFPNSNKRNMTLIFMIYGTDIGEIYATFGTYMTYI